MIHGINDPRCPISQARLFRDKLVKRGFKQGIDFDYQELGKEGHGSTDKNQRLREFKLMAEFFGKKLQD